MSSVERYLKQSFERRTIKEVKGTYGGPKKVKASGKAVLWSYVIHHRPVPGFKPPYAIAVVQLAEGPRMMTNIVACEQTPEALQLDMELEVVFEKQNDTITLPLFRPVTAKG